MDSVFHSFHGFRKTKKLVAPNVRVLIAWLVEEAALTQRPQTASNPFDALIIALHKGFSLLRADVRKYRPEVYKSEKSKILKKLHKVALGKLLT